MMKTSNLSIHCTSNLKARFIVFLLILPSLSYSQRSSSKLIDILWADNFSFILEGADTIQKLVGNVELRQDTVYLYCDSALILNRQTVTASGNFILQHGEYLSMFADSAIYLASQKTAFLKSNVSLIKGKQKLFTDSLSYDANTRIATYLNNANLYDDTTRIRSKRGYFHAKTDDVFLSDNVLVSNREFTLKSDTLKFNATSKIVTFLAPSIIVQDSAQIYTERGYYDITNKRADFFQSPQYVKKTKKSWANFIRYDGKKKEITLLGNSYVEDIDFLAYASKIIFNEKTEVSVLTGGAYIRDKDKVITGDTITYDGINETYSTRGRTNIVDGALKLEADQVDYDNEREIGSANGRVIWQDSIERIIIMCDFVEQSNKTKYLKATGGFDRKTEKPDSQSTTVQLSRPLLIKKMQQDSLYISADSLLSLRPSEFAKKDTSKIKTQSLPAAPDSLAVVVSDTLNARSAMARDTTKKEEGRVILAYHDVRIYKSDMQALCDSLSYSNLDSTFNLYQEPIIWTDKSQYSADSISLLLAENQIDQVLLKNESFIITSPDSVFYNQIKGRNSHAFFENGKVNRVRVEGNSQSVYYVLDNNDLYIGINKTECSDMLIEFKDNDVKGIVFYAQPKATLHPMKGADHETLKLPGFSWEEERKPVSVQDLVKTKKIVIESNKPETKPDIKAPLEKKEEKSSN
jgi:lipopolysaccharide export system protein LptA